MPLASLQETASATLRELQPKAEEALWLRGDSKTEPCSPITKCNSLRKRRLDAMLSPCSTYHRSTEIVWFPTVNACVPVAFPIRRNRGSERTFCIQSLVLQTIPPSRFVPHFKVALGKSKLFAVCKIKENKVGSECKCCAPVCLGRGTPKLNPACPRPKACNAYL